MPAPTSIAPRMNWMAAINEDNGAGFRKSVAIPLVQIGTAAGNYPSYTMAPEDGYLHSVEVSNTNNLAASDTNFVTFSLLNWGQDGSSSREMLASVPENTTKATGGSAAVANARKTLKVVQNYDLLKVKAGDRLQFVGVVTGTLPAALANGVALIRFNP